MFTSYRKFFKLFISAFAMVSLSPLAFSGGSASKPQIIRDFNLTNDDKKLLKKLFKKDSESFDKNDFFLCLKIFAENINQTSDKSKEKVFSCLSNIKKVLGSKSYATWLEAENSSKNSNEKCLKDLAYYILLYFFKTNAEDLSLKEIYITYNSFYDKFKDIVSDYSQKLQYQIIILFYNSKYSKQTSLKELEDLSDINSNEGLANVVKQINTLIETKKAALNFLQEIYPTKYIYPFKIPTYAKLIRPVLRSVFYQMECPKTENDQTEYPDAENDQTEYPDAENDQTEYPDAENDQTECPDAENDQTECPDAENKVLIHFKEFLSIHTSSELPKDFPEDLVNLLTEQPSYLQLDCFFSLENSLWSHLKLITNTKHFLLYKDQKYSRIQLSRENDKEIPQQLGICYYNDIQNDQVRYVGQSLSEGANVCFKVTTPAKDAKNIIDGNNLIPLTPMKDKDAMSRLSTIQQDYKKALVRVDNDPFHTYHPIVNIETFNWDSGFFHNQLAHNYLEPESYSSKYLVIICNCPYSSQKVLIKLHVYRTDELMVDALKIFPDYAPMPEQEKDKEAYINKKIHIYPEALKGTNGYIFKKLNYEACKKQKRILLGNLQNAMTLKDNYSPSTQGIIDEIMNSLTNNTMNPAEFSLIVQKFKEALKREKEKNEAAKRKAEANENFINWINETKAEINEIKKGNDDRKRAMQALSASIENIGTINQNIQKQLKAAERTLNDIKPIDLSSLIEIKSCDQDIEEQKKIEQEHIQSNSEFLNEAKAQYAIDLQAEQERLAKIEAEQKAKEEAEKKVREEAERKAEQKRLEEEKARLAEEARKTEELRKQKEAEELKRKQEEEKRIADEQTKTISRDQVMQFYKNSPFTKRNMARILITKPQQLSLKDCSQVPELLRVFNESK